MSVYRGDSFAFVRESLESIFRQTYIGLDVFLFRDGPIDAELQRYLEESAKNTNYLHFIESDVNIGLACGLNKLLDLVLALEKYEYIARMDSDDISLPERISVQVEYLNKNTGIDVVGSFCEEFGASFALKKKKLPVLHNDLLDFSITRCPFIHPTVMFRTKVFTSSDVRYPTDTALTEDMSLWLLLLAEGYRFANIPEVLLKYRLNENTVDRRRGIGKGWSEAAIRFNYMFKLNRVSLRNVSLISFRIIYHILPATLIKYMYKNMRQ